MSSLKMGRNFTLGTLVILGLAACGQPDTPTIEEPAQDAPVETPAETPPVEAAEEGLSFDGSNFLATPLETEYGNFAFVLRLRNGTTAPNPPEFTETTPPMPFVVGGVWATQFGDNVSVNRVVVEDLTEYKTITAINMAGGELSVYADGVHKGTVEAVEPARSVNLGRGFQNRVWAGSVSDFTVYDLTAASEAPTPGDLSAYPVIYELDEGDMRARSE